jgi:RHS repeat-associated protein
VRFEYDAFARRTRKQKVRIGDDGKESVEREIRFVWDGDTVVHEIASDDGLTTWHWEPETFTPVAKEKEGRRWSIATDHLGTPSAMYDELGQLAWQMQLDLYGVGRPDTAEQTCPWRWPGQYEDDETGLYYNRFRYYDPGTGRYISQDPIGLAGGMSLYGYVDDTTALTDPFGLTTYDFATLMNMAQNTLDFGTAKDGAVFWSGPRMKDAQKWAESLAHEGKTTLEQTKGGKFLVSLDLFNELGHGSPVTPQQAAEIWDAASKKFAEGASGEVSVFSTGAKKMNAWGNLRTWWRVELKALKGNPAVTRIVRRRKDGTPCA